MSVINYLRFAILGAIHVNSPIYPHSKFINKPFLLIGQQGVRVDIYNVLRLILSEHQFPFVFSDSDEHLRKNKHTVFELGSVVVSNTVNTDFSFQILKSAQLLQDDFQIISSFLVSDRVLIFFNQYSHCLIIVLLHIFDMENMGYSEWFFLIVLNQ